MKQYSDFIKPKFSERPNDYYDESLRQFEFSQNDSELKEVLWKEALTGALNKYAAARGKSLAPDLDVNSDEAKNLGYASMTRSYELLQKLDNDVEARASQCTVCMPVAILQESPESTIRTAELIKTNSSAEFPIELVVWANAKTSVAESEMTHQAATDHYVSLSDSLAKLTNENFSIRTALDVVQEDDFSMSKVRSDYMDATIMESIKEDRNFAYPIVWLDADTTSLSRNAIKDVSETVRDFKAYYAHMELNFSVDWVQEGKVDDATKAVMINEVSRRQNIKTYGDHARGYVEESGLAFTLGVYLNSLGVDTSRSVNESSGLVKRTRLVDMYSDQDEVLPVTIYADSSPETVTYLPSARTSVSARRHYEVAKLAGALGLFDVDASGYDGELYTDMKKHSSDTAAAINADELREVIEKNHNKLMTPDDSRLPHSVIDEFNEKITSKKPKSQKVALALIKRYFDK